MRNVTFENVSDNPSTTPRSAIFTLTDGDGGTSGLETKDITVTAVNDNPTITSAASASVAENTTTVMTVTATDPDLVDPGDTIALTAFGLPPFADIKPEHFEPAFAEAENGARIVLPAASYLRYQNCECPQFYPLFPFNRFSLDRDDMKVFHDSWEYGKFPKNMVVSWHQDGIFFARMGLTEKAADYNLRKLADSSRRFPTFWGPGHDWVPDHNWGGSGMIGLQEMLMQTVGDRILLLPAWPNQWDVDFKLHAPQQTVVQAKVRNGEVIDLKVTPEERMTDIVIHSN